MLKESSLSNVDFCKGSMPYMLRRRPTSPRSVRRHRKHRKCHCSHFNNKLEGDHNNWVCLIVKIQDTFTASKMMQYDQNIVAHILSAVPRPKNPKTLEKRRSRHVCPEGEYFSYCSYNDTQANPSPWTRTWWVLSSHYTFCSTQYLYRNSNKCLWRMSLQIIRFLHPMKYITLPSPSPSLFLLHFNTKWLRRKYFKEILTSCSMGSSLLPISHRSQSISVAGISVCEFFDLILFVSRITFFLSDSYAKWRWSNMIKSWA